MTRMKQPDDWTIEDGPVPVHRDADETEVEAAEKVQPKAGRLRRMVFRAVKASGSWGTTGDELVRRIPEVRPYSLRPRLTELGQAGLIEKQGTRKNRNGNPERVWVAVKEWDPSAVRRRTRSMPKNEKLLRDTLRNLIEAVRRGPPFGYDVHQAEQVLKELYDE